MTAHRGLADNTHLYTHRKFFLMKFTEMLRRRWEGADSLLCVGLDPNPARFPKALQGAERPIFDFCREIVDATADLVCAFKPQIAYFASRRAEAELEDLIAYIHEAHPGIPVILDAKRGDIGSTAEHYALEAFERFGADCTTVAPYMGFDAVEPYLRHPEKGAFILCRTSNKSGDELQMLSLGEERLFEHVARLVAGPWNRTGELGLVVGATYPHELEAVRRIAPDIPLLVPGIGAQGGDIDACVKAGQSPDGTGMVINSGRAILYASSGSDWVEAARDAAMKTRDAINAARRRS